MISRGLRAFAAASFLFAAVQAQAVKPLPAGDKVAPDPAVRLGTMANGLRYAIMPNKGPVGAASIRLVLNVGSLEEEEGELGYAHFIEHMAFRSTRLAPGGTLDNPFASLGVALGRDQNAYTTIETTTFGVDLPASRPDGIKTMLAWMRAAADGIVFAPAAVDVERGVLAAELRSSDTVLTIAQREVARFQLPGLRSVERPPAGSLESLRAATPARLQAFYERWYRPENAMLVIVGDAPADTLQQLAEQQFSSWTGKGAAGVRAAPPAALPDRGLEAFALSGDSLPTSLSLCRYGAKVGAGETIFERVRREALSSLWSVILGKRLTHLSASGGAPLLGAFAFANNRMPDARGACVAAVPTVGKWKEALQASQAELRRFAKDGPSEQEVDDAIEQLTAPLRGAVRQSGSRISRDVAAAIAAEGAADRVFPSPEEALRTFQVAVAGVTRADVADAFRRDWSGVGPLLTVIAPAAPSKEELLAAWRANEAAAPLAAYADQSALPWLYDAFGRAGTVERRESFTDFVRLRFRNGAVLNFRQTNLTPDQVEIRIRFGRGASGLAAQMRAPIGLGAGIFPLGGLGKMDFEQIGTAFASTTWKFGLDVGTTAFVLNASPLRDQVADELQLLAAYMTDPGFRPAFDAKLPTAIDLVYRLYSTEPSLVAMDALEQRLFPEQPSLPAREKLASWHAEEFAQVLKPIITQSPIEVTIVGDISEAEALSAVAATFGALPPRPGLPAATAESPFRRFPDRLPAPITAYHNGPRDKAAAILMWPLYVAAPERRKEEYALSLVTAIFRARLFHEVRVTMGKAYAPDVSDPMPDHADQGYLAATLEATPADLDSLVAAARRIAGALAAGGIEQSELDNARALLVAARTRAQKQNGAWAGLLSQSRDDPAALDELLVYSSLMATLTLGDVRHAAAAWLDREPVIARALPAPAAGGPVAGPAAATAQPDALRGR